MPAPLTKQQQPWQQPSPACCRGVLWAAENNWDRTAAEISAIYDALLQGGGGLAIDGSGGESTDPS